MERLAVAAPGKLQQHAEDRDRLADNFYVVDMTHSAASNRPADAFRRAFVAHVHPLTGQLQLYHGNSGSMLCSHYNLHATLRTRTHPALITTLPVQWFQSTC